MGWDGHFGLVYGYGYAIMYVHVYAIKSTQEWCICIEY